MILDLVFLLLGIGLWWMYYGVECFINGAMGDWRMPFREAWRELLWNVPIYGWHWRLQFTRGDIEWAKDLPGPFHFLFNCVYVPLAPWIGYRIVLLMFF